MKRVFTILAVLLTISTGQSIDDFIVQGKANIKAAVQNWSEEEMMSARAYFERALTLNEKTWLIHYYVAYCDNQLVNLVMSKQDKSKVKKYVNDAIAHLKDCIADNQDFAEAHGLLSSLYGKKIALSPWTGFWYGPKSARILDKALSLEPENPRIHLIHGISLNFTPKSFGGGKARAKESLIKAAEYFIKDNPEPIMPDWGHSDVYAWLGLLEFELGNNALANDHWEKALTINPENSWVKHHLMPKIK